jgi:hypothetical protein
VVEDYILFGVSVAVGVDNAIAEGLLLLVIFEYLQARCEICDNSDSFICIQGIR